MNGYEWTQWMKTKVCFLCVHLCVLNCEQRSWKCKEFCKAAINFDEEYDIKYLIKFSINISCCLSAKNYIQGSTNWRNSFLEWDWTVWIHNKLYIKTDNLVRVIACMILLMRTVNWLRLNYWFYFWFWHTTHHCLFQTLDLWAKPFPFLHNFSCRAHHI